MGVRERLLYMAFLDRGIALRSRGRVVGAGVRDRNSESAPDRSRINSPVSPRKLGKSGLNS
ncbi:unnamed protein product [Penicillium camemberti]|uniref:Str. FM013 n=1 Tax=Penicillium camemberti (strain FM 013) TaxID=1429867 RepID=A0A0G4PUD0_PENC3|nr:unnamed protein product [Penicillium camemberti]